MFRSATTRQSDLAEHRYDAYMDHWERTADQWFDGTVASVEERIAKLDRVISFARDTVARLGSTGAGFLCVNALPNLEQSRRELAAARDSLLNGFSDRQAGGSALAGRRTATMSRVPNPGGLSAEDDINNYAEPGWGVQSDYDIAGGPSHGNIYTMPSGGHAGSRHYAEGAGAGPSLADLYNASGPLTQPVGTSPAMANPNSTPDLGTMMGQSHPDSFNPLETTKSGVPTNYGLTPQGVGVNASPIPTAAGPMTGHDAPSGPTSNNPPSTLPSSPPSMSLNNPPKVSSSLQRAIDLGSRDFLAGQNTEDRTELLVRARRYAEDETSTLPVREARTIAAAFVRRVEELIARRPRIRQAAAPVTHYEDFADSLMY